MTFTVDVAHSRAVDMERTFKTITGTLVYDSGNITAAVLGLSYIEECSPLVNDDNSGMYLAAPAYDGQTILITLDGADTPDTLPADTYRLTVKGY